MASAGGLEIWGLDSSADQLTHVWRLVWVVCCDRWLEHFCVAFPRGQDFLTIWRLDPMSKKSRERKSHVAAMPLKPSSEATRPHIYHVQFTETITNVHPPSRIIGETPLLKDQRQCHIKEKHMGRSIHRTPLQKQSPIVTQLSNSRLVSSSIYDFTTIPAFH